MFISTKLDMTLNEAEIAALIEVCEAAKETALSELANQFCNAILEYFTEDETPEVLN